jgi:NADH-quinone oxidoreductase subunit I
MIKESDIIVIDEPQLTPADKLYLPQVVAGLKTTFRHLFKKNVTVQYPEQKKPMREQIYRGVHRLNRDEHGRVACVACFMCETACPAHCIHIEGGESPWPDREKYPVKFDIDELRCIYCGMCEEACPVDAIELTPEYSIVGLTRDEMVFDKEKLLEMFDKTRHIKPRANPRITGYPVGGPIPPSDDDVRTDPEDVDPPPVPLFAGNAEGIITQEKPR